MDPPPSLLASTSLLRRGGGEEQTSTVGTLRYTPPETVTRAVFERRSDVYSFSLVFWEMLHREVVFSNLTSIQAAMATANGDRPVVKLPTKLSAAEKIMVLCWHPDAQSRPDMSWVVQQLEEVLRQSSHAPEASDMTSTHATNLVMTMPHSYTR